VAVLEELDERLICSIRVFAVFTVALPSLKDLPSKLGAGYFYPDTILFLVDGDTSSVASPLPSLEARVGGSVPVDFNLRESLGLVRARCSSFHLLRKVYARVVTQRRARRWRSQTNPSAYVPTTGFLSAGYWTSISYTAAVISNDCMIDLARYFESRLSFVALAHFLIYFRMCGPKTRGNSRLWLVKYTVKTDVETPNVSWCSRWISSSQWNIALNASHS
jgi:hypothetical protein